MKLILTLIGVLCTSLLIAQTQVNGNLVSPKFAPDNIGGDFGDGLLDANASALAMSTEFGGLHTSPITYKGATLGSGSNVVIITNDIGNFSKVHDDPMGSAGNYLIAEPGLNSGVRQVDIGYYSTTIWSQDITSLAAEDQFDFNLVAAVLETGSYSPKTAIRIVAKSLFGGSTIQEILSIPISDLSKTFTLFKEYQFVLTGGDIELRIELIHAKNESVVVAIDDIHFSKSYGFELTKIEYCVNDPVSMLSSGLPAFAAGTTFEILNNGTAVSPAPNDYAAFSGYTFPNDGEFLLRATTPAAHQLIRGREIINNVTVYEATATVYARPGLVSGASDAFDHLPAGEKARAFINNIEFLEYTDHWWEFENGKTSTFLNPTHEFEDAYADANGEFNVKLTAYNKLEHCKTEHDEDVTICLDVDRPTIDFTTSNNLGTKEVTVQNIATTNTTNAISEYEWSYGDAGKQTRTNTADFAIGFQKIGRYPIMVRIEDGQCKAEKLHVIDLCEVVEPGSTSNPCKSEFTFELTSGNYDWVKWYDGYRDEERGILGNLISEDPSFLRNYRGTGIRTIIAQVHNGCEVSLHPKVIEVLGEPNSEFLAFPKTGVLELRSANNIESTHTLIYEWTLESFDEGGVSLGSPPSPPTGKSVSYSLPVGTVKVSVSLKVKYDGWECEAITARDVCIPSDTHDCCETCVGG